MQRFIKHTNQIQTDGPIRGYEVCGACYATE